ncbi:MAG: NUDIX hydrolase [Nitriliruptoraceae bacterium]|nr:NUDIX hydrolase [Nitriliruptoraceae bacterium]
MRVARVSPWRTTATREVYRNPWITVREDQVVRPDGSPGIYGVVSTSHAVGVVALTDADEVVLIGQWRYTLEAYSWEIVEGGTDAGEAPAEAAVRELAEEAGYAAATWSVLVEDLALSNSVTDERATIYLARDLTPVPTSPDPTEVLERRTVSLDALLDEIDRGLITDAITIVAAAALDRRLRR